MNKYLTDQELLNLKYDWTCLMDTTRLEDEIPNLVEEILELRKFKREILAQP